MMSEAEIRKLIEKHTGESMSARCASETAEYYYHVGAVRALEAVLSGGN